MIGKHLSVLFLMAVLLFAPQASLGYEINNAYFTKSNGHDISLSFYEGKYLLIDAMATWCQPCRVEMVHLKDVYTATKDQQNFQMISISMDNVSDTLAKVGKFMDDFNAKWEYGLDNELELSKFFRIGGYPTTILLDPQGKVLRKWVGITDSNVILTELDNYFDLPGHFARQIQLSEFLTNLVNNKFFVIFLMMIWILIFYNGYKVIEKYKGYNQASVDASQDGQKDIEIDQT